MRKRIYFWKIVFMLSLFINSPSQAEMFVSGFEDIPLMEGLKQNDIDNISFGNEETTYRETLLLAPKHKTFNQISSFYKKTMPQLGWSLDESNNRIVRFLRENSILEIMIVTESPLKIGIILKNKS